MAFNSRYSIQRSNRRLTRDWHNILVDDIDESKSGKCTTRRKTLVNEMWVESVIDIHNLVFTELEFITGSTYEGQRSKVGMEGMGTYTFPHGVVYEGQFRDGMFHGKGILVYPQGQAMNCTFKKGKMTEWEFLFSPVTPNAEDDSTGTPFRRSSPNSDEFVKLKTDDDMDLETYCKPPDRRFYKSYIEGLKGAPLENITNDQVPRIIPSGCYDMGDGFYNPRTKWVHSSTDKGNILYMAADGKQNLELETEGARRKFIENIPNIPVYKTENWILERCRKSWDEKIGYKPELYEYWFSGRKKENEKLNMRCTAQSGKFKTEESLCEEALKYIGEKQE